MRVSIARGGSAAWEGSTRSGRQHVFLVVATMVAVAVVSGGTAYLIARHGGSLSVEAVVRAPQAWKEADTRALRDGEWTPIDLTAPPTDLAFATTTASTATAAPRRAVAAPPVDPTRPTAAGPPSISVELTATQRDLRAVTETIQTGLAKLRAGLRSLDNQRTKIDRRKSDRDAARESAMEARAAAANLRGRLTEVERAESTARHQAAQARASVAQAKALAYQRSREAMLAVAASFNAGGDPAKDQRVRDAKRRADEAAAAIENPETFIRALERDADRAAEAAAAARGRLSQAVKRADSLSAEARNQAQTAADAHRTLRAMRVDVERSREQLLLNVKKARRLAEANPGLAAEADIYMLRQFIASLERRRR